MYMYICSRVEILTVKNKCTKHNTRPLTCKRSYIEAMLISLTHSMLHVGPNENFLDRHVQYFILPLMPTELTAVFV